MFRACSTRATRKNELANDGANYKMLHTAHSLSLVPSSLSQYCFNHLSTWCQMVVLQGITYTVHIIQGVGRTETLK